MRHVKKVPLHLLILCAVIALGFSLRAYGLTAKSLWYDETGFIAHALKGLGFMLHPAARYKIPYIILLKSWAGVFGIGAFAVRFLSVLLGAASVFLTYRLGKRLFDSRVGLIAAFLLAISCFDIYHTQQVKHYGLLTFLALLAFISFIDFLERGKRGALVINLFLNALVVLTHPYGLCVIPVQFLYVACVHRSLDAKLLRMWLWFQIPTALFSGFWAWTLLAGKGYFEAILWWARPPDMQSLKDTFSTFSYGGPEYGLSSLARTSFSPWITTAVMLVFGIFFLRGLFLICFRRTKGHQAFAVVWLTAPLAGCFLFSYLFFPAYLIKNFLFFLPAFYLIVARGIDNHRRLLSPAILAAVFLLNVVPLKTMYGARMNVDWQKAVRFVTENGVNADAIIVMATTKEVVSFMYYFSDADPEAMKDILIFGKFEDGRWQESFRYKDYSIITLGSELAEGEGGTRDPGSGINKVYNSDHIAADFEKKVMRHEVLDSNRQLWLLISGWAGDAYRDRTMSDKLKAHFDLTLLKEVKGIKIYRFMPRRRAREPG